MAISKLILNGDVQMDVTSDTVSANRMLNGYTATKNDGTKVTGNIATKSASDMTASGSTVTAAAGYYASNASKSVATGSVTSPTSISGTSATVSTGTNTLTLTKSVSVTPRVTTAGYVSAGTAGNSSVSLTASVTTKSAATITPSTSAQTIASGTYLTGTQTISAMPSGTAGTPTATKGTVSNHAVSVTPSVTNTTGYITGGTKTGTAVSVSASELVSGTYSVTGSGTKDVTNYASVSVPSGTEGTPTASKGTVSNHSVSVTPSVTNSGGYITGSTKTGTAVSVSASELVSGTKSITENGTSDVTNYASVNVDVPTGGGVDCPVFTINCDSNYNVQSVTCDKTFAECSDIINDGTEYALANKVVLDDGIYLSSFNLYSTSAAEKLYTDNQDASWSEAIQFLSNGTINYLSPSPAVTTLTATSNGTYTDSRNRLYSSVTVNVPTGGSGGLEYEAGIWTPTEDISSENIYFANTHTKKPCMFMLSDTTGTYSDTTNTNYAMVYTNFYDAFGVNLYASTGSVQVGLVRYVYRATNATSLTAGNAVLSGTGQAADYVSNTHIIAHSNSTSRYWRAGRSYKWIAVWAPTI